MKPLTSNSERPRPLLIAGRLPAAPDLALRRILRAKQVGQPLVVVDYQASLAHSLTKRNAGSLHKGPMVWCDLANRRRPTALFRLKRTPGMKPALQAFLAACVKHLGQSVTTATINAVVDLAHRLVEQGSIGLAALQRSLTRPELSHPLRQDRRVAQEIDAVVSLLEWALRFPAVWAISEGNNVLDLHRALAAGGTTWIEVPAAHMERAEHLLVQWLVDAALLDALLSLPAKVPAGETSRAAPIVVYGLPTTAPFPMAVEALKARHVGVFGLSSTHPLSPAGLSWLSAGADCWIAGDVGELSTTSTKDWLDDAERSRLRTLEVGQVWVRSGQTSKAVTMLVRPPESTDTLAAAMRRQAAKALRPSPVKQFSTALIREDERGPKNADLFASLCTKEALYAGWFRVKAHNRRSYGHDRITIAAFGANVEVEIDRLAAELTEARYRSRPLRTARIPKADGDWRVLRIACVRDRVVQAACLHLIEPLFECRFSPTSFAYRPGRGAHHAVALARSAIGAGKHFAVTADIKKCFDTIDHEILLRLIGDVIADRDLIRLIRHWLTSDIIDFMDIIPSELGIPQGEAISPLFSNIYLDPLDKEFERLGMTFVRYADDYLVLCASDAEAQAALRAMREFLEGVLRLTLKPAKTQHCHVSAGVSFLGFIIEVSDVQIPKDKVTRAVDAVKGHLATLASTALGAQAKWQAVTRMNLLIMGFRNYFLLDGAPSTAAQLAAMDADVDAFTKGMSTPDAALELVLASRERFMPESMAAPLESESVPEAAGITGAYIHEEASLSEPSRLPVGFDDMPAASDVASKQSNWSPRPGWAASSSTAETPDVLMVDGRLHVMTSGCYVSVNGDDLLVRRRKNDIFRVPITDVSMAYLEGKGIALSADLTMRLCEQDIPVVFTPLIGIPAAIAQSVQSLRSSVRQQQVLRRNDPEILKTGLGMLAAKVANQASVLKYCARYRKRTPDGTFDELTRSADDIRVISETLDAMDPAASGARASGMGYEGRAAAKYWSAFGRLVPAELAFPGRHTRHATDPLNSAINYVYAMLYGEVWRVVVRNGLDPYFGIIHGTERDQGSLVFDMIEEYRAPFGDRLVLGMLGRGLALELDKEGFLRTACRHKLVSAFHKQWRRAMRWRGKMRSPSEILECQAASLKRTYLGGEDYRAFRFRW